LASVVGLFGVVLGGTIASGEWLATAEHPDGSTAFDRSVTSWMVDHRASGATLVARVFSAVGSQKALVPVVVIMALVLIGQRGWRSLGLLGVAWGGAILGEPGDVGHEWPVRPHWPAGFGSVSLRGVARFGVRLNRGSRCQRRPRSRLGCVGRFRRHVRSAGRARRAAAR
jgi:hypothetical protein